MEFPGPQGISREDLSQAILVGIMLVGRLGVYQACSQLLTSTPRGFQGYWLKYTVKGPQFEETNTQIFLNQKLFKWYQNDSQKGENRIFEIPEIIIIIIIIIIIMIIMTSNAVLAEDGDRAVAHPLFICIG